MAGADYYSCDVCHTKTFYDCALDYQRADNGRSLPCGAGDMKVICTRCSKTHKIHVQLLPTHKQSMMDMCDHGET